MLGRKPRSQGILDVTFADSAMAELIQRGVFFMGSSSCLSSCSIRLR
jgi:hypothetical protein